MPEQGRGAGPAITPGSRRAGRQETRQRSSAVPFVLAWRWRDAAGLRRVGDGRHPGVAGEGVVDGGQDMGTVLGGGGDVAADGVPVASGLPGAEPADPVALAGYVREQWWIESLHWIRDTLYQEDKSQVRTRSGPRIMAGLRNLAIGALRLAGRTDVTEATRWAGRSMDRPFTILGLTS
jgi:hypothetical protein